MVILEEDFKIFGFDENLKYNKETSEFLLASRFIPSQKVYIVIKKRFGKIEIVKDEINYISFTNCVHYSTKYTDLCFSDYSKNIFDNKDDAYKYAETLIQRKGVKFRELAYGE